MISFTSLLFSTNMEGFHSHLHQANLTIFYQNVKNDFAMSTEVLLKELRKVHPFN